MKFRITHQTTYSYDEAVTSCHNEAHLIPRDSGTQRCLNYRLDINPAPGLLSERDDFFGNKAVYYAIDVPHHQLVVTAS